MWQSILGGRLLRKGRTPWDGKGASPRFSDTSIEQAMAQILATLGAEGDLWQRQFLLPNLDYPLQRHEFDFAIPALRVLIECDGCFFHGCQRCHPDARSRTRDILIDQAAARLGWTVLRYWEHEIKGDRTGIRDRLQVLIEQRRR